IGCLGLLRSTNSAYFWSKLRSMSESHANRSATTSKAAISAAAWSEPTALVIWCVASVLRLLADIGLVLILGVDRPIVCSLVVTMCPPRVDIVFHLQGQRFVCPGTLYRRARFARFQLVVDWNLCDEGRCSERSQCLRKLNGLKPSA